MMFKSAGQVFHDFYAIDILVAVLLVALSVMLGE